MPFGRDTHMFSSNTVLDGCWSPHGKGRFGVGTPSLQHQSINMSICIAPNRQKSSEVLAAKQMRFELFLQMCQRKAKKSAVRPGVCSMSLASICCLLPNYFGPCWNHTTYIQYNFYSTAVVILFSYWEQQFRDHITCPSTSLVLQHSDLLTSVLLST